MTNDGCRTPLQGVRRRAEELRAAQRAQGEALQNHPVTPKLKPPGTKRLRPKCDILLSTFAFKFKLWRYNAAHFYFSGKAISDAIDTQLSAAPRRPTENGDVRPEAWRCGWTTPSPWVDPGSTALHVRA